MLGAIIRMIKSQGRDYVVHNATGGGGRTTPNYTDDGTLTAVLESRREPRTVTNSDGTEVMIELEMRAVPDEDTTLRPAGDADGFPTLLEHPTGVMYRVLDIYEEDNGVTVLSVEEE